jgi:hypothetical protein
VKTAARRKRSPMSRLRPYWVAGGVVALLGFPAAMFAASEPVFHLKHLAVTGLARVARSEVVARAAIDPQTNVWFLNKRSIENRIDAIAYVLSAHVHRRPPADVTIDVTERTPSACVRDRDGREVTIDRDDRVLEDDCADRTLVAYDVRSALAEHPGAFVRSPELADLEAASAKLGASAARFRAFSYDGFGQLVAVMPGGIAVEFGDAGDADDLGRKERLITPILAQLGPRATDVKAVDLRAVATPVVEYRAPLMHRRPQVARTE